MKIAFNPSTVAALTTPPNNKDITFDLRGRNIFARGVKFYGTDTNTWRDIKINNVSIGSNTLDLRNGSNTTLTNTNGVVTINSTWRPVVDNLTSDSTTSSLSAKQGKILKSLIDGKSNSGHTHDDRYVRAFETSNDNIDSDWGLSFKTFDPIPSGTPPEKNPNISILNIGNNFNRRKLLAFIYNNDNIYYRRHVDGSFTNWRRLAFANEIPTSLKNPHALTISLNGTSQGPYDGSAAKNINITPGSIGAAVSNHSHDYLVVNAADDKSFNSAYHNFLVLYAGGGNGITGKPANVDAFGLFKFRIAHGWSGQMLLATGGSLYIRSSEDAKITNTLAWKTILDSSNYSGILDSRYYTESEVNNLLNTKLNRQNLSYGTWNPRDYNLAADYSYNGGNLSISENGGKMYVSIDGLFYQNEGLYRVLDTSDIGSIRGGLTLYQHLSATDTTRYPLVWGGSDHKNTNNSTGSLYKSYDKLSWLTSSLTLYATNIQTNNIKNLSIGGGIYWNPYAESTTDGSDAASITLVKSGVAGGTTLVLSLMNDTNDTILFQTNGSARLYHNSYPILTTLNTYVSNNKGYINGTEITLVNNANKWITARTFTVGNTSKSVDGSSNVSWSLSEIGAASSNHNHDNRYVRKWTGVYGNANKFLKLVISDEKGWIRLEVSDSNNSLTGGYGIYMIGWGLHGGNNGDTLFARCLYANDSRYTTALKIVRTSRNNYDFYFLFASGSSYPSYTINYSSSVISIDCTVTAIDTIPTATWTSSLSALQLNASQVDWSGITNKPSAFIPAAHTHTVFKNNLMIKGTNGISDSASIHLGIGDSDTGFKWISDGKCLIYANNTAVGEWTSGGMNWFKNPTVNGNKVWNAGNDGSGSGLDADLLDGWHLDSIRKNVGYSWSAKYRINNWSRIIKIDNYSNILLAINFSQTSQASNHLYLISTGYGCGNIVQLGANGFNGNSAIKIRLTENTATSHNVEIYSTYGYNGATELSINCNYTRIDGISTITTYLTYTAGGGTVRKEITSSYSKIVANLQGNSDTTTKLQTPRQINGTNFDGSANITTSYWGTTRTLTIGNSGKSVNGSANISWSLSEIGAADVNHTHGLLHSNLTVKLANTTTDSGWSMINSSYNGFLLKSIRTLGSAPNWIENDYAAGICFGGADTKGVVSVAYRTPYIKFAGGNGSKPVWWIRLSGISGATYNLANFNADTLDGEHASSFVRAGHYESADLNKLDTYSFIRSVNSQVSSTSPKGNIGWYNVILLVHRNGDDDGPNYIGLIALGMTSNVNDIFFRCRRTDPWKTIIHSNNYTEFINNYYWANVKISTSSSTTTSPTVHTLTATRVCAGHNPGIDNSISCSNWFRSSGDTGWYNTTYSGGWYMSDTSWIRAYNGVGIYTSGQIYSPSSIRMGNILLEHTDEINNSDDGGIHLNYRNSGNISLCVGGGKVGIGTVTPLATLDVGGTSKFQNVATFYDSINANSDISLDGLFYIRSNHEWWTLPIVYCIAYISDNLIVKLSNELFTAIQRTSTSITLVSGFNISTDFTVLVLPISGVDYVYSIELKTFGVSFNYKSNGDDSLLTHRDFKIIVLKD